MAGTIIIRGVSNLVLYAIPAFIVLMALEALWARRAPDAKGYERRDTRASLAMGVINVTVSAGAKFLSIPLFALVYELRLFDLGQPTLWWSWVVLFFAEDFFYYWFHRTHHEVRLFWAVHVNHHSSEHYNLSTALRQAVLTPITGPVFWAPLALLGYPPWMILTAQAWSLLYQFWLHTEAIGRLGPLEWLFNTPSHHRVHHGKNVRYLDKNHGGVLILWDRLFGTFQAESERVIYGLTTDIKTFNLWKIGFHELAAIAADVRRAPTLRAKLGYIFAPPGWSHDGSTQTAGQLQRML
jgi:sterol desaturase/sphingolipid hydroxylase (fatty acid hydroxylase superfamily)